MIYLIYTNLCFGLKMVSFVEIKGRIIKGLYRDRPNRFLALVQVKNRVLPCFLPNPGRMHELLIPGVEVFLREAEKGKRKTSYDMIGVIIDGEIVSLDTRVPNRLVFEALKNKDIIELAEYDNVKPEYGYGNSRFDFLLKNDKERCLVEVKSCTLVRDGVALFPDAPTLRGQRHLMELIKAKKEGFRTCVVFIIQRTKAKLFTSNDETDPSFGKAFRDALAGGVEAYAYISEFDGKKIALREKVRIYTR
jgi:sugar fermentation stimulation protein A